MPVSSFMNVRTAKQFLNQMKEIAAFIAPMEQYLVHQFKKINLAAKEY